MSLQRVRLLRDLTAYHYKFAEGVIGVATEQPGPTDRYVVMMLEDGFTLPVLWEAVELLAEEPAPDPPAPAPEPPPASVTDRGFRIQVQPDGARLVLVDVDTEVPGLDGIDYRITGQADASALLHQVVAQTFNRDVADAMFPQHATKATKRRRRRRA